MHILFLLSTVLFTCFSSLQAATPSVVTYDNLQEVGKAAAQKIADTIIAKQQEGKDLSSEELAALSVNYERLNSESFQQKIVGNTVVGSTRQSNSLYMLYFAEDGSSELCKQGQIFKGFWWIDKDDVVHAYWPDYQSANSKSLFSPENPSYGKPTSISYYLSATHPNALILATKSMQTAATVVPGRQLNGK